MSHPTPPGRMSRVTDRSGSDGRRRKGGIDGSEMISTGQNGVGLSQNGKRKNLITRFILGVHLNRGSACVSQHAANCEQ